MARSEQWRLHEPQHVVAICESQFLKPRSQLVRPEWQHQPAAGLWRPAADLQRQLGRALEALAPLGRPDASLAACSITVIRHVAIANPNASRCSLRFQHPATAAAAFSSSAYSISASAAESLGLDQCHTVANNAASAVPSAAAATTAHVDRLAGHLRTDHVSRALDRFQQHDAAWQLYSTAELRRKLQPFIIASYEHVSRHYFCASDAATIPAKALPAASATTATAPAS